MTEQNGGRQDERRRGGNAGKDVRPEFGTGKSAKDGCVHKAHRRPNYDTEESADEGTKERVIDTRVTEREDALLQGDPTVQHSPNDRAPYDAGPLDEVLPCTIG